MHPLDIAFLLSLILGGGYLIATALMGGLSHAVGHIGHGVDVAGHHIGFGDASGHLDAGAGAGAHAGPVGHGHGGAAPAVHGHVDAGAPVHPAGHAPATAHGGQGEVSGARQGPLHISHHLHAHLPHSHGSHEGDEGEGTGIAAYLNPMIISAFLFGFGGVGVAARLMHLALPVASVCAAIGGFSLYWVAGAVIVRMFAAAQATSHNRRDDLVGLCGKVTAPISPDHPGMIAYTTSGSRQSLRAISEGETIGTGATVRIRRVDKSTAVVTLVSERDQPNMLYH